MSHIQCMYSETSYLFLSSSVFTSFSVDMCLFGSACAYPGGHALVLVYGFVLHGVAVWVVLCCID